MLKHADIWAAIDALARDHGLTASALARKAGLDPTTFNKSKRITREGKARWPSTESVAKVLDATGASMARFLGYIESGTVTAALATVPLIGVAQAREFGYFDDAGLPIGSGWDEIPFPQTDDPHAYALEINGETCSPLFRDGDVVIVSPSAGVRRGDRVVVRTRDDGEVMIRQLVRLTTRRIELLSLHAVPQRQVLATDKVAWLARILWISQ